MDRNKLIVSIFTRSLLPLLFSFTSLVLKGGESIKIGVSRIDITPDHPVRLTGYGNRTKVYDSIAQKLWAKGLVLDQKGKPPMIWVTLDLVGFPGLLADDLYGRLASKIGLKERAQLAISATHTHNGPETGVLLNIFGKTLPPDQLSDVKNYRDQLLNKLEKLVMDAYTMRIGGTLSWAMAEATFAMNRRVIENGKWKNFGETPGGPVDNDLPVLRATDQNGNLIALLISYACHGTTLVPEHNFIHGDWMGATQDMLEQKYPGVTAMVALGCAGDANPSPRGELIHVNQHAKMITEKVEQLMHSKNFSTLNAIPIGSMKKINLTFMHVPDANEFVEQASLESAKGLYARNSLEILARGGSIPNTMVYPIQVWNFTNQLAIVFLGGEVVVDYSLRIKREFNKEKIWVNAYSNDVSTYIASKRIFAEGGYEVDGSMPFYNHPSRLTEDTEETIMKTLHKLISKNFVNK